MEACGRLNEVNSEVNIEVNSGQYSVKHVLNSVEHV